MTNKQVSVSVPAGLKVSGRRLWTAVLADYELEEHERGLLVQACQTADIVDGLQAVVEMLGVDCAGRELVEIRQQRLCYARLLAALRLPAGDEGDQQVGRRPQRRVGVRGFYAVKGGR